MPVELENCCVIFRTTSLLMAITRRTSVTFHLTRGRRNCSYG